jgi:hypothetical protein
MAAPVQTGCGSGKPQSINKQSGIKNRKQPPMLLILSISFVLVIITVFIHAVGFSVLLRILMRTHVLTKSGFWSATWLVIALTYWLLLIHLAEIAIWGLFYFWQGCLPDAPTAFYFSGITYTAVGYGDLVLPNPWRILAPIESMTGILMFGLSSGIFFAIVFRRITYWMKEKNDDNRLDRP